jgi:hypothetical protein
MPKSISQLSKVKCENVYVSLHAFEAMEDEGIPAFKDIEFSGENILEAEIIDNIIKNVLIELPFNSRNNLNVAISFKDKTDRSPMGKVTIKTVFLRNKYRMDTLNKDDSKYYNPVLCWH